MLYTVYFNEFDCAWYYIPKRKEAHEELPKRLFYRIQPTVQAVGIISLIEYLPRIRDQT